MIGKFLLVLRCVVVAVLLWLGVEGFCLIPLALFCSPIAMGITGVTCAIYSDNFSSNNLATDYTTLSGSFSVSGGECSCTTTSSIICNSESSTGHGKASIKAKSSATGNYVRLIGAYNAGTYIYAELYFNGASSTWKLFTSGGTQLGITRTISLSTSTYYTLFLCWDGSATNAILGDSSAVCMASIHGTYAATGTKAGFGATMSSGTATFDDFAFSHAGELISGVTCDSCTNGMDMTSSACSCSKCSPLWYGELDVDVSGMANSGCASGCSSLDGLFRLTREDTSVGFCDGSTLCCWKYDPQASTCCTSWRLEAILSNSGGTHTLTVQWVINGGGGVCNTSPVNFSKSYVGQPDCESWSGETLTYNSSGTRCDGSGATVSVTAVNI